MTDEVSKRSEPPSKKRCIASSNKHCCVPGCTNDSRYDEAKRLSFHNFPKDETFRKKWMWKIRRDEGPYFKITRATPVCSDHFVPSDFKRSLTGLRRELVKGAVPSVFSFDTGKPGPKKRKSPKKRVVLTRQAVDSQAEEEEAVSTELCEVVRQHELAVAPVTPDHDYTVAPASAQEKLEAAHQRINELEDLLAKERKAQFSLDRFAGNDAKIRKYTGFKDYHMFKTVFSVLQPCAQTMIRWSQVTRNNGVIENCRVDGFRNESLALIDQFFFGFCVG